jgi:hypothetical protein
MFSKSACMYFIAQDQLDYSNKHACFLHYGFASPIDSILAYARLQVKETQWYVFLALHSRASFWASSSFVINASVFPCITSHSMSFRVSIIICFVFLQTVSHFSTCCFLKRGLVQRPTNSLLNNAF